jgi:hypothetical protein
MQDEDDDFCPTCLDVYNSGKSAQHLPQGAWTGWTWGVGQSIALGQFRLSGCVPRNGSGNGRGAEWRDAAMEAFVCVDDGVDDGADAKEPRGCGYFHLATTSEALTGPPFPRELLPARTPRVNDAVSVGSSRGRKRWRGRGWEPESFAEPLPGRASRAGLGCSCRLGLRKLGLRRFGPGGGAVRLSWGRAKSQEADLL